MSIHELKKDKKRNVSQKQQVLLFLPKLIFEMRPVEIIQSKIFENAQAFRTILDQWKQAGETIVFTNGCFDLVHRGHIDSLAKAAEFGDRLIVGLNSDVSVRLLKGKNRPLVDQQSRAVLLASMLMVDAVIMFDKETPYELIQDILPDVLVKGSEYQIEEIAGYDIVLASGGRVERIELTEGFSTSDIIQKVKNKFLAPDKG
jgi:rfaE bifunctional protein nucleotidyltransferase chain/domain